MFYRIVVKGTPKQTLTETGQQLLAQKSSHINIIPALRQTANTFHTDLSPSAMGSD